jgi:hypothetical protein
MGFAVLHIEKGTAGSTSGLGNHIDRTKQVLNADPEKSGLNFYVRPDDKGDMVFIRREKDNRPLKERIQNRITEGYKGKTAIRKDAVTHLNIILTGSHNDMKSIENDPQKLKDWAVLNYTFIGEHFGWENIVEFSCHCDERTPHIHCVVVPLTADGRLSAKEVMGDRRKLSRLQDIYGKVMEKKFGLQRGMKGSTATHDSVKEYYARINQRLSYPAIVIENSYNKVPKIPVPPMMGRESWAEKQNKAIFEAFSELSRQYQEQAQKKAGKAVYDNYTSNLQTGEAIDRLRKENARLRGHLKFIDRTLNPEKYISVNKNKENTHTL